VVFGAVSSVDPQISWCPHADPCPMWGLGAAQANVTEALLLTLIALGGSLTTSIALIGGSE
jgi:hypothetical protein